MIQLKQLSTLATILLLATLPITQSCKDPGQGTPTAEEQQIEKLTKTWTVESVTFGGSEDRTTDWSGFTLTVTGNQGYSTTNAFSPGPWPASGTWSFATTGGTADINKVLRDDGLEIAITVSATSLTMTFTYDDTTHQGGRTEAVNGEYVFKMKG